jgi:hypothetical protein
MRRLPLVDVTGPHTGAERPAPSGTVARVVARLEAGDSLDQAALALGLPRDLVRSVADHAARTGRIRLSEALPCGAQGCPLAHGTKAAALTCGTCPAARA